MPGGITDEFVEPVVCDPEGTISDNDSVIFFNYRPDRAREITRALVDPAFDGFTRQYFPVTFVCTTEYDAAMPNVAVAFPRLSVRNGLGEYLSSAGHDPAAHCGDGEVCPCDLFLQRRRGDASSPVRTGCWCPPPRWRPTTSSRR